MSDIITIDETAGQPKKVGNRWYVTIARPGQGSSGFYSEEVLKTTGPSAFPPGTKSYFGHAPTEKRDVRDQVGVFKEGAFWNAEEGELGGYLYPAKRYKGVLDEMVDEDGQSYVEASIHAACRKDGKGVVRELVPRRDNTVDLVAFAGLEGSGLKYQVESLFAAAAAEDGQEENKEKNKMTFELTQEAWDALSARVSAFDAKFDTFVAESKVEIKGEADAAAVETAVAARVEEALAEYAEVVKSIEDADIPKVVKESLVEKAGKGEDVSEALAGAIVIATETKKEIAPEPKAPKSRRSGTVVIAEESAASDTPKSYRVGRWSN